MDYKELLYEIQQQNKNTLGPRAGSLVYQKEELYQVDLNTRIIHGPEFISVKDEHRAEIIYFELDRYHGNVDLSRTNCIIQYQTSDGKNYFYPVPFCDVHSIEQKMIIPWLISAAATAAAGEIQYVIRFYLLDDENQEINEDFNNWDNLSFKYNLSTTTAKTQILLSLPFYEAIADKNGEEELIPLANDKFFELLQELNNVVENAKIYWIEADELQPE